MMRSLYKSKPIKTGKGLLNSAINSLPFEIHVPGYQFCGPGTKLEKRLERGDKGINPLDSACRDHDIAYSKSNNLVDRHKADRELENRAWERVKSGSIKEKAVAYAVMNAMKAKRKIGMGCNNQKQKNQKNQIRVILK
ncbi:uncharacterized protein LOC112680073, partial [Sipha flava]|uniref:Uncharacterized protein LOC112680073 n=1 Tax=Sipha flava TaxID=143950 RepID=A0A8B8F5P3_9HEMI